MSETTTISDLTQLLKKIQEEKIESDKCMQRTIRELQQQIDECVKQTRSLKTEIQHLQEQLRKSHI